MNDLKLPAAEVDYLLSPEAIRASTRKIYDYVQTGNSHFLIHPEKLESTVTYVLDVIYKKYPDLNIPFHSRWGHFRVGNRDRAALLPPLADKLEAARQKIDLVITSVLLDAGAGAAWSYFEKSSGEKYSRSEGLGVASFYLFMSGRLSADKKSLQADVTGLKALTENDINEFFQVSESNPLLGVTGRLKLLNNLSLALENRAIFRSGKSAESGSPNRPNSPNRPGNILDYLIENHGGTIPATAILRAVLDGLGPIWPGRLVSGQTNLGDVWRHQKTESLVAFHKLSQWMTYSLIEPIEQAGILVNGVEKLTGLAEYRNGGLLIDSGLVSVRDPADLAKAHAPDSDLIIEWRALTIYFLDVIGAKVQHALKKTPAEFPLAKVLEGGTWWAGRFLAQEKRQSGDPPIQIKSDGTVF